MPGILRCCARFDQVAEKFGNLFDHLCHVCRIGQFADPSGHINGGQGLTRQQVVGGDHADRLAVFHDRKMAHIVSRHGQKRVKGIIIGMNRDRVGGHDFGYRFIITAPLGNNAIAKVAVGHDAGNLVGTLCDQQAGNSFLAHQFSGFKDGGRFVDADKIAGNQVGDLDAHEFELIVIAAFNQLHAAAQPVAPHLGKEIFELRVFPGQLVKVPFRQQVTQAVFKGGDVIGSLTIAEHRAHTETFPFGQAGKKLAVRIAGFGAASPDDV